MGFLLLPKYPSPPSLTPAYYANTQAQISMTKVSAINVSSSPSIFSYTNHFHAAGGTPDRIGGAWQLRRISSVVVNGDNSTLQTLYQRDTHKGIILSTPLKLMLAKGKSNTIKVAGLHNGVDYKGADLDRIVVYPAED